ncbi:hypothetical protein ACTHSO_12425, partial [Neisseria sp. P0009.S004]|uniref:hypothetical protein n=1 Tax=Neisseria sp. P0009.S004 TaxID=3436711 RepID=UPI003F8005A7
MSREIFAMMVSFVIVYGKRAYSNIGKGRLKAFSRPLGVTSNNHSLRFQSVTESVALVDVAAFQTALEPSH